MHELKAEIRDEIGRAPFREPWWLRGGHAQTIYGPKLRRPPPLLLRREILRAADGDELHLHHLDALEGAPRVLLLHGLEGSAASPYVLGTARCLRDVGLSVTVMEHRSCSGVPTAAPRLYHCGETTDLAHTVATLVARAPGRPLFVCGFSLGGNQLGKWLGERGDDLPPELAGAAIVSPPFDLTVSGPHIDRVLFGVYTRHFLRSLVPKALAKADQFPDILDRASIRRARTFAEFDTHATARLHGFADAQDYWARVSCGQFLAGIRRPTLLVAAHDDPFNPGRTIPHALAEESPYLVPAFTERGGHVGFVMGSAPSRPRFWAEELVARYFARLRRAVVKRGQSVAASPRSAPASAAKSPRLMSHRT